MRTSFKACTSVSPPPRGQPPAGGPLLSVVGAVVFGLLARMALRLCASWVLWPCLLWTVLNCSGCKESDPLETKATQAGHFDREAVRKKLPACVEPTATERLQTIVREFEVKRGIPREVAWAVLGVESGLRHCEDGKVLLNKGSGGTTDGGAGICQLTPSGLDSEDKVVAHATAMTSFPKAVAACAEHYLGKWNSANRPASGVCSGPSDVCVETAVLEEHIAAWVLWGPSPGQAQPLADWEASKRAYVAKVIAKAANPVPTGTDESIPPVQISNPVDCLKGFNLLKSTTELNAYSVAAMAKSGAACSAHLASAYQPWLTSRGIEVKITSGYGPGAASSYHKSARVVDIGVVTKSVREHGIPLLCPHKDGCDVVYGGFAGEPTNYLWLRYRHADGQPHLEGTMEVLHVVAVNDGKHCREKYVLKGAPFKVPFLGLMGYTASPGEVGAGDSTGPHGHLSRCNPGADFLAGPSCNGSSEPFALRFHNRLFTSGMLTQKELGKEIAGLSSVDLGQDPLLGSYENDAEHCCSAACTDDGYGRLDAPDAGAPLAGKILFRGLVEAPKGKKVSKITLVEEMPQQGLSWPEPVCTTEAACDALLKNGLYSFEHLFDPGQHKFPAGTLQSSLWFAVPGQQASGPWSARHNPWSPNGAPEGPCDCPPKPATCQGDKTLLSYTPVCQDGACTYKQNPASCNCVNDACVVPQTCEGGCSSPPPPSCKGDSERITYLPKGECVKGTCSYTAALSSCKLSDHCVQGFCVPKATDPCAGVVCGSPPAPSCDGTTKAITYGAGSCSQGNCSYAKQVTTCKATESCKQGACVPKATDPCAGVSCTTPPAPKCSGSSLLTYGNKGACSGGTCSYPSSATPCPSGCASGSCTSDPCGSVSCSSPPAAYCQGNTLVSFGPSGSCSNGQCSYPQAQTPCPFGCQGSTCVEDPCAGVFCNHGTCSNGECVCQSGFAQPDCSGCLPGYGGPNCQPLGQCGAIPSPPSGTWTGGLSNPACTCNDATCHSLYEWRVLGLSSGPNGPRATVEVRKVGGGTLDAGRAWWVAVVAANDQPTCSNLSIFAVRAQGTFSSTDTSQTLTFDIWSNLSDPENEKSFVFMTDGKDGPGIKRWFAYEKLQFTRNCGG